MQVKTAEGAAFIVATCISILSIGGVAIDYFFAGGPWEWYYVSYTGGVFVGAYFITRWVIRKFIAYRIKPIYEIALSRDIKVHEIESQFANDDRMLEDIGEEVSHWAQSRKEEIRQLKDNEQYRRDFVGNISHELKTPLFNIQGYITTLLDGGLEDPKINREYLKRADRNIDRLVNILNDLDAITKLESGMLDLHKSNFDINAMAHNVAYSLQFQAQKKKIRINVQKMEQPLVVYADKKYMEQVITNLVTNAIRYGNVDGHVNITFIDMFEKVGVEVSDDGIGIAREHLPYIFDRFFRVDKSRSREQGGTGLGLSIVKHIVNAHEEGILVRSTPGKGTTFLFTIIKGEETQDLALPRRKSG